MIAGTIIRSTFVGRTVDTAMQAGQERLQGGLRTAEIHARERSLTLGELNMVRAMFGTTKGFIAARIFPYNFWWPFANNRAMTPMGSIFFPHQQYRTDYSVPTLPLDLRALFMHEATHIYQYYVLGIWVMVRGAFDRRYDYELVPGRALKDYQLEQMGQIVEDYYKISHGGMVAGQPYVASDYRNAVPVRPS